jgi:hypothetical protein
MTGSASSGPRTPGVARARNRVPSKTRDSRAPRCTRRGAPVGRAGFDNVRGQFSIRGAHCLAGQSSGSAYRRSVYRGRGRPSSRPEATVGVRGRVSIMVAAERRAGAEAKPHATARAGGSGQWPLPWGSQALGPERAVGGIGPIRSSRHAPRPLAARKAGASEDPVSSNVQVRDREPQPMAGNRDRRPVTVTASAPEANRCRGR